MKFKISCLLIGFLIPLLSYSAGKTAERKIIWNQPMQVDAQGIGKVNLLNFQGAFYDLPKSYYPGYFEKIKINAQYASAKAVLSDEVFEDFTEAESAVFNSYGKRLMNAPVQESMPVDSKIGYERKEPCLLINFIPIRKNAVTGNYQKLVSFNLDIIYDETEAAVKKRYSARTYSSNSVLASGNWFKIGVVADGVYKLSYSFLKALGMDVSSLNVQNLGVYGNGGGQLAYLNSVFRHDDLTENAIRFIGNADAVFDSSEYFLFYGQSPNRWTYNAASACNAFTHTIHQYSDTTYYFITADLGAGKRMANQPSSASAPTTTVTAFDDYGYYEKDLVNLIKSGKEWFGEKFDIIPSYTTSFNFPNIVTTSPVSIKAEIAARADGAGSQFTIGSGSSSAILNPSPVPTTCYFCNYASI